MPIFKSAQFEKLWNILQDYVVYLYGVGRGQHCKMGFKNAIVIFLTTLLHSDSCGVLATVFKPRKENFERLVAWFTFLLDKSESKLFNDVYQDKLVIDTLKEKQRLFRSFLYAPFAEGVSF